jgi:hypothetical protein
MSGLTSLSNLFFLAGFFVLGIVFMLLFELYRRVTMPRRSAPGNPSLNLMEMMILFQTMREVVHDQKALAREFNQSVDKKVTLIRELVRKVLQEHKKITQAQRDLAARLEITKQDFVVIQEQVAALRPDAVVHEAPQSPKPAPIREGAPGLEPQSVHAVAPLEEDDSADDLIDNWVGLDFVGEETEAHPFEVPETVSESVQDPERAREAFRALLNMDAESSRPIETAAASPGPPPDIGDGRDRPHALRQRVYEYHDAGMGVAQIAHELGIGKGEVRLMLGLREKGNQPERRAGF